MGKNKAARKAAPDFESRTYESLMAAARAAKTIEQKRGVLIQLNEVAARLSQKDIATWRQAWQMALNVENPKRGRLYDCYTDALIDLHLTGCIGQRDGKTLQKKFVLKTEDGKEDDTCTAPQKLDTFGVFFMKYNYEIRLKAVKLVLEGGLSVREAGCHLGCGRSQVHLWVTLFERHGLAGLKLRHGSYSAEFKLSVLKHMHQNHLSLLETAVHFGIPGPFVIRQWERLYQNQGAEGLRRKPQRRRPAMSKSKTKKVKLKTTPHEELLKELEYLRAENAYLKKLQALVEERIVRESGKEPKPSKD